MKILKVSQNNYLHGGSDQVFFSTARILEEHGHEVIPFAAASPNNQPSDWEVYFPPAADFEKPGVIDITRYVYSIPAVKAITKLLEEQKPDIAHLHIYYGKLTASILAPIKSFGIPIVQTLHDYKLVCPVYTLVSNDKICEACQGKHFLQALPKKCNRGSAARTTLSVVESYISRWLGNIREIDHFIAVSDFLRYKLIDFGVPAQKISTIYNFIEKFDVSHTSRMGDYYLYYGRLERIKGIFSLIDAAASIAKIPLIMVGNGSARSELEQEIDTKHLQHIKVVGFKEGSELRKLIQNCLCTILPSEWYEPSPLTIFESLLLGKPVIGSNIGGITELITDNVDGFLFPPGDVNALNEKMKWLAKHPKDAVEMGLAGQNKVQHHYNPDKHYERLMRVYQSVM